MPEDDVIVRLGGLKRLRSKFPQMIRVISTTIALELDAAIQENITINNQIDTGAMRAGVFVDVFNGDQGRESAISKARAEGSKPGAKSGRAQKLDGDFAIEESWKPEQDGDAKVGMVMDYSAPQNALKAFVKPAVAEVKALDIAKRVVDEYIAGN
jgi:hypothetical protein